MNEQSNIHRLARPFADKKPVSRLPLIDLLGQLDDIQFGVIEKFVSQVIRCHDPEIVRGFLEWKDDPQLGSILEIAADLDEEHRDQLLFFAEGLLQEQQSDGKVSA